MGRLGGFILLALAVLGCGKTATNPGSGGEMGTGAGGGDATGTGEMGSGGVPNGVLPGQACTALWTSAPHVDGCNTCSCNPEGWSCTTMPCPPECTDPPFTMPGTDAPCGFGCYCWGGRFMCMPPCPSCSVGDVKPFGDGCNTCTCVAMGEWSCTGGPCAEPDCGGDPDLPEPTCEGAELYGRADDTGACCTHCSELDNFTYYASMSECNAARACSIGDTKIAGDGCNTCYCDRPGEWACTNTDACQPEPCDGFGGGCSE
jgi:hypothetical protein